jgi:hypothetical protein
MSEAFAYRLSFIPTDANVSPEECMAVYCYDTLVDAQMAAADDASATAKMHANAKEREEWAAYATTAANVCAHVLDRIGTAAFPVHVRHGDNPRHVGTYRIVRLTEGDAMDCSTCKNPGTVTYIGGRGNVIACCDDCREEDDKSTTPHTPFHSLRIRDRVEFVQDVERYPHFIAHKGFTGYVSRITHQTDGSVCILEVKCDQHLPDCEEWDNSVVWVMPEDDADAEALARV